MLTATGSLATQRLVSLPRWPFGALVIGLVLIASVLSCGVSSPESNERDGFPGTDEAIVICDGVEPLPHVRFVALAAVKPGDFPELDRWLIELGRAESDLPQIGDFKVISAETGSVVLATIVDHRHGTVYLPSSRSDSRTSGEIEVAVCDVRIGLHGGYSYVDVHLDPESPPTTTDTSISLLVIESRCDAAVSPIDRLRGFLVESDDMVTIKIVRIDQEHEFDCRHGQESRVRFELSEPLGDRSLLDGTYMPPSLIQHPIAGRTPMGAGDISG